MADEARKAADKELRRLEKDLHGIYRRAAKDLVKKAENYMKNFERLDNQKLEDVKNEKITEEEYKEWRKNKLLYGEHFNRLVSFAQKEMLNCNKTALQYINDKVPKVFAESYNHIAEAIEDSDVKGYSFELIDAETVKKLSTNRELMLPKKDLDPEKDKAWNARQVNTQILQGVLQGESIPKIAARMANVCNNDSVAMVRTARTMITAAENSGRQAGMDKAQEGGIMFKKMWIATNDERTRETHAILNGQLVDNDEPFVTIDGDEIQFPGDWNAPAKEVYNCRCSLGCIVTGFDGQALENFEDWPVENQENVPDEDNAKEQDDVKENIQKIKEKYNNETDPSKRESLIKEAGKQAVSVANSVIQEYNDFQEEINRRQQEYKHQKDAIASERRAIFNRKFLIEDQIEYAKKLTDEQIEELKKELKEINAKLEEYNMKYMEYDKKIAEIKAEFYSKNSDLVDKINNLPVELLSRIRDCGTDLPIEKFFDFSSNKKVDEEATDIVRNAFKNYPTEWIERVFNEHPNVSNFTPINCIGGTKRGEYGTDYIHIPKGTNSWKIGNAYHELMHCFEEMIPNILENEKSFYDRRTKNDKLKWLGVGYKLSEKSKFDDFLDPYIGKYYSNGKAFEVLSMGCQMFFGGDIQELLKDPDYAEFVIGTLCIC